MTANKLTKKLNSYATYLHHVNVLSLFLNMGTSVVCVAWRESCAGPHGLLMPLPKNTNTVALMFLLLTS